VTPPELTASQRAAASAAAVEARRRRAAVRADLKSARISLVDALALADADDTVGRMRVIDLLRSLPGIGTARAAETLERLAISAPRRVRGLGRTQRSALLAWAARREPAAGGPVAVTVLSGPSGVGKGTLVRALRARFPRVWVSVSATTRAPRPGEVDGVDYLFWTRDRFDTEVAAGRMLEWAAFAGNLYGTPRGPVEERMAAGIPVLLEIEVQGARQVRASLPEALLVFLAPPSFAELARRLAGRGTEDPAAVTSRLRAAEEELAAEPEFDVTVVNDSVEAALADLVDCIRLHPLTEGP
jgi:guanylate kinase